MRRPEDASRGERMLLLRVVLVSAALTDFRARSSGPSMCESKATLLCKSESLCFLLLVESNRHIGSGASALRSVGCLFWFKDS